MVDVIANRPGQVRHAVEYAVANAVVRDVAEPPLDNIQPRTAGRSEMHLKAWMAFEPRLDLGVLVRGVVVNEQMQVQFRRRFCI